MPHGLFFPRRRPIAVDTSAPTPHALLLSRNPVRQRSQQSAPSSGRRSSTGSLTVLVKFHEIVRCFRVKYFTCAKHSPDSNSTHHHCTCENGIPLTKQNPGITSLPHLTLSVHHGITWGSGTDWRPQLVLAREIAHSQTINRNRSTSNGRRSSMEILVQIVRFIWGSTPPPSVVMGSTYS